MNVILEQNQHSTLIGQPIAESLTVIMKVEITLCRENVKLIWTITKCKMPLDYKTSQPFGEIVRDHPAHPAQAHHHHLMQMEIRQDQLTLPI